MNENNSKSLNCFDYVVSIFKKKMGGKIMLKKAKQDQNQSKLDLNKAKIDNKSTEQKGVIKNIEKSTNRETWLLSFKD